MTNREKFKKVFNTDIHWSRSLEPQIMALKSAYINGIDCMEEWLNAEYKEPRKGRWIGHREHCENLGVIPSGLGVYEWCSECDCGIDVREWHRNHYNYCPNCGADMRGEEE